MKKKELKNIYKSVNKSVKRVVNHYKYYELADGMVLGIYETPDGVLVRLKQTRDLVPNSNEVFPELKLSGLELLGVAPSSTTQLTLKEHDMKTGEKMSTNWYRHRPVKPEDTKKEETPVLYKEMQKDLIEDLDDTTEEPKKEPTKEQKASVITSADLEDNIWEYEDILKKGCIVDLDNKILETNPEHVLLNAGVTTAASKIIQDAIELRDHLDDEDLSPLLVGIFRNLLIPLAQGVLAKDAKYKKLMEDYNDLQNSVEPLKREKAKANDTIGDLNKEVEKLRDKVNKMRCIEKENKELDSKSEIEPNKNKPSAPVPVYTVSTMKDLLEVDISKLKDGDLVKVTENGLDQLHVVVNACRLPQLTAYAYIGDETHPSELCDILIRRLKKEDNIRKKYVNDGGERYLYANDLRLCGKNATEEYRKNHYLSLTRCHCDDQPVTVNTKLKSRGFTSAAMDRLSSTKYYVSYQEFKTLVMVVVDDNIASAKILIKFLKTIPFKLYSDCSRTTELLDKLLDDLTKK